MIDIARRVVFPTRVGMSRSAADTRLRFLGFPYTRRDEPHPAATAKPTTAVFPTRVGMSRLSLPYSRRSASFPYTRRDEPVSERGAAAVMKFSLHA